MDQLNLSEPPAIRGEAVAGRAGVVKHELELVVNDIKSATFDLAELLSEANANAYHSAWGYETFADFVTKELDLKKRRARYLIRIVQVCAQVGVPRSEYEPVGVSKLREITSLEPGDHYFNLDTRESEPLTGHITRLIDAGEDMTLAEIIAEVKRLKGLTGDNELVWINTCVSRSVRDNVILPAREVARAKLGSAGRDTDGEAKEYSDGACEEVIHADWLADPTNTMKEPDESAEQTEEINAQDSISNAPVNAGPGAFTI